MGAGIYQSGRNHYVGRQIKLSDGRNMERYQALHQGTFWSRPTTGLPNQ